jgi:hypothetical protein
MDTPPLSVAIGEGNLLPGRPHYPFSLSILILILPPLPLVFL